MMSKTYTFIAVIKSEASGGAYVEVPFDVEEAFGKKREGTRRDRIARAVEMLQKGKKSRAG